MSTAAHFPSTDPAGPGFRAAVGEAIADFLASHRDEVLAIGPELGVPLELAGLFTSGGKRLRPAFCWWGRVAAGGQPEDPQALLRAAASLDLLHVSALVHDDVMDASDTRRGVPAAHKQFERLHAERSGRGDRAAFGRAGAILLGDLLLVWSGEMLDGSGLTAAELAQGRPVVQAMRTEVTCGQFLDVVAQGAPGTAGLEQALATANQVVEYKTNRYTVQRPLQLGAAIGGADQELLDQLARFASPLGRAFQFRDDLLGIFGDEQVTGKPAGDDLREGKRTVLVAHAMAGSSPAARSELDSLLGRPELAEEQVARGREIIAESGAKDAVERTIEQGYQQALAALEQAEVTDEGRAALEALARAAVQREA